jgi:hypothetical protein
MEVPMRAPRLVSLSLACTLVAPLGVTACRSSSTYDVAASPDAALEDDNIVLVVRNDNFADVDVHAVTAGLPRRIGTVTGNTTARFALSRSHFPTGDLNIMARPIGGSNRVTSGLLSVFPGMIVNFIIQPVLSQSFATVQ